MKAAPGVAPEPIGVYDHPAPAGESEAVKSVRLANIGAVPALELATRARDYLYRKASDILSGL